MYKTYEECKNFIKQNLKIKTQRDFNSYITGKSIQLGIPANPRKFFKEEFLGWGDFLCTNNIANQEKEFLPYNKLKEKVIELGITSIFEYKKIYKKHNFFPSSPDQTYKEWISWYEFLNKEKIQLLSFEESKKYLKQFWFKSSTEYIEWYNNIRPNNLSANPEKLFKEWISYSDYLGYEEKIMSYGSQKVQSFLDKYSIKYKKEKTFPKCKNKKVLKFDFYLVNYNICIEYDGEQHFKPNKLIGGIEALEKVKIHDEIKNKYCLDNNIILLRISYTEQKNIENILKDFCGINNIKLNENLSYTSFEEKKNKKVKVEKLSYKEAKEYIINNLEIRNQRNYKKWVRENNLKFLYSSPEQGYKELWVNYYDYLSIKK